MMAQMVDGRIVKNFSIDEMANKESDDEIKLVITPALVLHAIMMQELRDWWKKAMEVNSWYRTPLFNKSVGGDPKSCHLDGIATDIALPGLSNKNRAALIAKWKQICAKYKVIGGVSIYAWGLHFDSNADQKRYAGHVNYTFRVTDFRRR